MSSVISARIPSRTSQGWLEPTAPLYQQLSGRIRRDISSGRYKSGERIPPESELTAQYGVSRITVRRALQELAAEGLLVGVRGKGTFVNTSVFTAVDTYLFVYGMEVGLDYPFTGLLLEGICGQNHRQITFRLEMLPRPWLNAQDEGDNRVEDLVTHTQINGVLTLHRLRQRTLQFLVDRDIPVVQFGLGRIKAPAGVVVIAPAYEKAFMLLINHLKQRGWRRIGYIAQPTIEGPEYHRRHVREYLAAFDLPFPDEAFEEALWGVNGGMEAASKLFDRCPDLDAIMTSDDLQALGVMLVAERAGRVVGKDLAITGAGNILGHHSNAGLTTIDPHIGQWGKLATQCLRDLARGKSVDPLIRIEPELVVRQST